MEKETIMDTAFAPALENLGFDADEIERLYAPPRLVTQLEDCSFYHTMDIPGHGTVDGPWDLRAGVRDYLGGVDFRGKRVLELGTASGFLCFHMERQGAQVVAFDVSPRHVELMNVVPFARGEQGHYLGYLRGKVARLNNSWWLAHRAFQSAARVVYGDIYAVPEAIGPVDIATFGCILLHLRDPFQALASALPLVRDTVIITETFSAAEHPTWNHATPAPSLVFQPNSHSNHPPATWWSFSPQVLCRFLGVLGFEETRVTYHTQLFRGQPAPLFTVVGRRTAPATPAVWYQT
jgi:SAM-dependent methyltransferase